MILILKSYLIYFNYFPLHLSSCYFMFMLVCLFVCTVDHGVTEEELVEEFGGEYREPEPEDPYRDQELPEGFEDGKSNSIS